MNKDEIAGQITLTYRQHIDIVSVLRAYKIRLNSAVAPSQDHAIQLRDATQHVQELIDYLKENMEWEQSIDAE